MIKKYTYIHKGTCKMHARITNLREISWYLQKFKNFIIEKPFFPLSLSSLMCSNSFNCCPKKIMIPKLLDFSEYHNNSLNFGHTFKHE